MVHHLQRIIELLAPYWNRFRNLDTPKAAQLTKKLFRIILTYKNRTFKKPGDRYRHLHRKDRRLFRWMSVWRWESQHKLHNSTWEPPISNAARISHIPYLCPYFEGEWKVSDTIWIWNVGYEKKTSSVPYATIQRNIWLISWLWRQKMFKFIIHESKSANLESLLIWSSALIHYAMSITKSN